VPAGTSGIVAPEGVSSVGGLAATEGGTGASNRCGPEAPRASAIPPWTAIDNNAVRTQTHKVFAAPLVTSPLRPDMGIDSTRSC